MKKLLRPVLQGIARLGAVATWPATAQSYYPEERRKGLIRIYLEVIYWSIRKRELPKRYFSSGLDRASSHRISSYLSAGDVRRVRDGRNGLEGAGRWSYLALLRDKYVFGQYVTSLGFPVPRMIALCTGRSLIWIGETEESPIESVIDRPDMDFDGFCKEVTGAQGHGVFALRVAEGRAWIGGHEVGPRELVGSLSGARYLIQDRVRQHPDLDGLYPGSINTLRVITYLVDGKPQVFCAMQRTGANGGAVDNWAAGGLVIGVDRETGRLRGSGFYKPGFGGKVARHPNTGISFDGFQIPHFERAVALACGLHQFFYGIHSIGWDIAIGDNGPVILEGNDDWGAAMVMAVEPDFSARFRTEFVSPG